MPETVALVQARMGSSRLPGKVLLPLGPNKVLEWVLTRCRYAETVDRAVALLGDAEPNAVLREWCDRAGYEWVSGPEDDLLARHRIGVERTEPATLVRITGDCPFVPPAEIDRTVARHRINDAVYTSNRTDEMPIGTAVDVLDPAVLAELAAAGETHPVKPLLTQTGRFSTERTGADAFETNGEAHVAVDMPADYWTLQDAVSAAGTDPAAVVAWVADHGTQELQSRPKHPPSHQGRSRE